MLTELYCTMVIIVFCSPKKLIEKTEENADKNTSIGTEKTMNEKCNKYFFIVEHEHHVIR